MRMPVAPSVVVGFDGSPTARGALLFAADEAVRRNRPLRIVSARENGTRGVEELNPDDLLKVAASMVRPIIVPGRVALADPAGPATVALLAESDSAELVVVGRGVPRLTDVMLGSVAADVVAGARCPVLIVGDSDAPHMPHTGPVVVGIDLAEISVEALEEAFMEAGLRSCDLVVVCAWHPRRSPGPGENLPLGMISDAVDPEVEERVREIVAPVQARHPGVATTVLCRRGSALTELIAAGSAASMIVVGSRRRGTVASLFRRSIGQALTRHAGCPVLVAHPRMSHTARLLGDQPARGPEQGTRPVTQMI